MSGYQDPSQIPGPQATQAYQGAQNISVQQMSDLVNSSANVVRALANIAQILSSSFVNSTKPAQLAVSTVAALPTVTLTNVGSIAFANNGRNTGEGAAAGTGCAVQVQNKAGTAIWCAIWSGVAVTA